MNTTRAFPFKTALNASTLFPFQLDVTQQVQIAAQAGYSGVELWIKDIEAYLAGGGTLEDLRAVIADSGVAVVNAIAFFRWADTDEPTRRQGLQQAQHEMELIAALGCPAVAAPPYGNVQGSTLAELAGRFGQLCELARAVGVEPYLEFWGRAKQLSRLSDALVVAMESGRLDVRILLDPFHMYTGGSELSSLAYVRGANIGIVHVNDYPAAPPREHIGDHERVFPGEGIAPTHGLAHMLDAAGYRGYLSLELFVDDYAGQSALSVARRGLEAITSAYSLEH